MQVNFDLISFWNVVVSIAALGAGVLMFMRHNQRTYIELIRQTAEGWQQAAQQKSQEVGDLKQCVADLQTQLTKFKDEHGEVLRLNVRLQQDITDRDRRIQHLETQV